MMMVTVVSQKKMKKVGWRDMLIDAEVELRRICGEGREGQCGAEASVAVEVVCCDGLVLGHGSAEPGVYRVPGEMG